jgi:hypothetical protein
MQTVESLSKGYRTARPANCSRAVGCTPPTQAVLTKAVDGGGLDEVKARLVREFGGQVTEDEIKRVVDEEAAKFAEAEIDKFVPVLVERRARKRLRHL